MSAQASAHAQHQQHCFFVSPSWLRLAALMRVDTACWTRLQQLWSSNLALLCAGRTTSPGSLLGTSEMSTGSLVDYGSDED